MDPAGIAGRTGGHRRGQRWGRACVRVRPGTRRDPHRRRDLGPAGGRGRCDERGRPPHACGDVVLVRRSPLEARWRRIRLHQPPGAAARLPRQGVRSGQPPVGHLVRRHPVRRWRLRSLQRPPRSGTAAGEPRAQHLRPAADLGSRPVHLARRLLRGHHGPQRPRSRHRVPQQDRGHRGDDRRRPEHRARRAGLLLQLSGPGKCERLRAAYPVPRSPWPWRARPHHSRRARRS